MSAFIFGVMLYFDEFLLKPTHGGWLAHLFDRFVYNTSVIVARLRLTLVCEKLIRSNVKSTSKMLSTFSQMQFLSGG